MSDGLTARSGLQAAVCIVVFAVVGALAGVLWSRLWSPAHGVVQQHRWFPDPWDAGQQHDFAGTGWYVTIALLAGIVLGVAAVLVMSAPELVVLAAVAVGSVVAALVMWRVGLIGNHPDPTQLAKHAADGTRLPSRLHLALPVPLTVFPLGALGALATAYLTTSKHSAEPGLEPAAQG